MLVENALENAAVEAEAERLQLKSKIKASPFAPYLGCCSGTKIKQETLGSLLRAPLEGI